MYSSFEEKRLESVKASSVNVFVWIQGQILLDTYTYIYI